MVLLAQLVLCSAAIFTPLRQRTPQYQILVQPNGDLCGEPEWLAREVDASYHEFVCGDVEYRCAPQLDEFGGQPWLGNGMMAACYRAEPEPTCGSPLECIEALLRSLRRLQCQLSLITLADTDVMVQRFDWFLPGKCRQALRWGVVQQDALYSHRATIVISSTLRVVEVRDALRLAWPQALFKNWAGQPSGCIE